MDDVNIPDDQRIGLRLKCPYCGWRFPGWATEDQSGKPIVTVCPQCKERIEAILETPA